MIISDKKRFIFIHIEKTAGTSIEQALLSVANPVPTSKVYSLLRRFGLPRDYHRYRFGVHAPLAEVEDRMPADLFRTFFKFAFVRNPWDRLVSEYNAAVRKRRRARHRRIASLSSFGDFVRHEIKRGKFFQYPRICGVDGGPGLDFVGRFENVTGDFERVREAIGVDADLGHFNAYRHQSYRDYYDDQTRELVREHWRRDIEYFGYEF